MDEPKKVDSVISKNCNVFVFSLFLFACKEQAFGYAKRMVFSEMRVHVND